VSSRTANVDALSEELSSYLKPKLEELFINLATTSGWPSDIISEVSVVVGQDMTLSLDYPPALKSKIDDLEYGAIGEIPNAVIRPFMLRAPKYIEEAIKEKAMGPLLDGLVTL
jgi:hypothetical protein